MAIYIRAFHHIASELDLMNEYVLTVRGALKSAHEKFNKRVGAIIADMDEEQAQEYINDSAEDDIALGDLFPALNSSWTFVSIISFLEHQLVYICREVGAAKANYAKGDFSPKKGVLDACKDRLKELSIAIPASGAEWSELKKLQEIRNTIVHRLGEVEEDISGGRDAELYRYTHARNDIKIEYQKIVPTHAFCQHAIELVRSFLGQVVALIPKGLYATPTERPR
jgi:hypothetical protein